jgi:hypothetical protein
MNLQLAPVISALSGVAGLAMICALRAGARDPAPLAAFKDSRLKASTPPAPTSQRRPKNARRHEPPCELHTHLSRLSGVDVTRLDGIAGLTAPTLIAAIGLDRSRWKTAHHCASWLG